MFEEIEPLALAYEREVLSGLSQDERASLRAAVDKLLNRPPAQIGKRDR
jgi:DNA-binding MarR family transcriptional regulator